MTIAITGIPEPPSPGRDGPVPLRLEMDQWYKSELDVHKKQINLFQLALYAFQQEPPSNDLSYFQVAGMSLLYNQLSSLQHASAYKQPS